MAEPASPFLAEIEAELWADVQPTVPPRALPLLAHYTSIGTLERVARNGELWLSNPLYMNDVDELRFGINLGLQAVRAHPALRDALPPEVYNALLDAYDGLFEAFDNDSAFDVYVFSCSEHTPEVGDDGLLSMWRGYGGNGNGVAMVFDWSLLPLAADSPLMLRQVQYMSHEESEVWMDAKLTRFAALLGRLDVTAEAAAAAAEALFERVKLFALFTKHRGFHEEREWRLVYLRERDRHERMTHLLHYAIDPRGIEPKLRFSPGALGTPEQPSPALEQLIRRVILGPMSGAPLVMRSVVRMLEINRPALASRVAWSTTPYRAQRRS
jgi:hypothetical protein